MYSLVKYRNALLSVTLPLLLWQCGVEEQSNSSKSVAEKPLVVNTPVRTESYQFGRVATANEIAGWDIDIRPDGQGLPEGSGTAEQGEPLYEQQCAVCHGSFGEGNGRWPRLSGGEDSLTYQGADGRPEKTVGSYWPYASTLFDYIRRAMPYPAPMSLEPEEVYAISAYVLYLNDLIEDDFVLDKHSLPTIQMANEDNFYIDDRPDVRNTACMEHCKDPDSITIASSVGGVTPISHFVEGADSPAASHDKRDLDNTNVAALGTVEDSGEEENDALAQGRELYKTTCSACHQITGQGLVPAFPSLHTNPTVKNKQQLIVTLLNGREGTAMQSYSRLSDEELAQLLTFVRKSWSNNESAIEASDISALR